jgi:aminoacrylate peracid reductase
MPYQIIVPEGSAPPLAQYSPGAKAGNALYVSGTLALDSAGNLVGKDDVKAQTRHILETIKAVVEAAGGSLKDITFNHVFLSDMAAYAAMNEV